MARRNDLRKILIIGSGPIILEGNVLLTVADKDKAGLLPIARKIDKMGFSIYATGGTNRFFQIWV